MSKPVLFVSFRPLNRAENLRAIYNAYEGDKMHLCTYDPHYTEEVTSGKYDLMVIDEFPSVTPGKCIMIWHGIQGGKYIGLDQPGSPYYKPEMADMMTCIISAGTGMVNVWNRCTGVPKERILPLGMPRTDWYVANKYTSSSVKHYLFVPTFRDDNETPFPDIDWAYIDSRLNDNELLIIKAHPWQVYQGHTEQVAQGIKQGMYKNIRIVSAADATSPYLYISDVVITDYSSVMFDAYLLNKPVVLFEKTPGYVSTRGMYLSYPHGYCTYCANNEEQLLKQIRYRAQHPELTRLEKRCMHTVADMCDGHSCERICKLIDQMKGE